MKCTIKQTRTRNSSYRRGVLLKARRKAKRALEDLAFLSRFYIKAVDQERLFQFLKAYLGNKAFSLGRKELKTSRLPPSLGRKRLSGGGLKFGSFRDSEGAPLMKELGRKYALGYLFAKVVFNLRELSTQGPLEITEDNGEFEVKGYVTLANWLLEIGMLDWPKVDQDWGTLCKRSRDIQARNPTQNHIVIWRY